MPEHEVMPAAQIAGRNVLIVGGAGFVGSNLAHMLLDGGVESLDVVDNLLSSEPSNLPSDPRTRFIFGSITHPHVLEQLKPKYDYVFHLACYHGNQSSIADPMADHANNLLPSLVLFDYLSRNVEVSRVVYAAAGCAVAEKVYGDATATREDTPVSMFHDSPYSISKVVGELYGNYFWQQSGLPFVKARFQNVYGPREILGAGQWRGTSATIWRNVVPTFIWKALHGDPIRVDADGTTTRDFIFVEDVCQGLLACASDGLPGQAYNIASGVETSIGQLATTIVELTGSTSPIVCAPRRSWDRSGNRFADSTKASEQLGFSASTGLRQGLKVTVEWSQANEGVIRGAIDRHLPMVALGGVDLP